jgi:hypothetical protein
VNPKADLTTPGSLALNIPNKIAPIIILVLPSRLATATNPQINLLAIFAALIE